MTKKIKPPKSIYLTMSASSASENNGQFPDTVSFSPACSHETPIEIKSSRPITFVIGENLLSYINDSTVSVIFTWGSQEFHLNEATVHSEHFALFFIAEAGEYSYSLTITNNNDVVGGELGGRNPAHTAGDIIVR